jgi:DNA repair protein RecN (Recombination protein N)
LDESAGDLIRAHESAAIELEELERSISDYRSNLDIDPEALHTMEGRLNLLQSLQRKYRRDENGLLELITELRERLEQFGRRDEMLSKIDAKLASETGRLKSLATELSGSRMKTANALSKSIHSHLKDLGFGQAAFDIRLDPLEEARSAGFETVEFLFAANTGEPLKPLRAVASSGERSLGENRQVITITHMPQVAAAATRHFTVSKTVTEGRTRTSLTEVDGESRVEEIARMLGGRTKSALDHARELLKRKSTG